jgi:hypothetical protein
MRGLETGRFLIPEKLCLLQYFQNCTTLDALTKERNRLAKIHHPDVGGSLATMQDINAQFDEAKKRLESPGAGRTYTQPAPKPAMPKPQDPLVAIGMPSGCGKRLSTAQEIARKYLQAGTPRRGWEARRPPVKTNGEAASQSQVDQQSARLKEELAWGLNQIRLAQAEGLLSGCTAYTDRMQATLKVGGNTYPYREWFKAHGFRWDPEKKQWHFHKKPLFYEEEDEEDDELDPQDIPC